MDYLVLKNLVKRYSSKLATDDVSFNVKKAEIFGLLGPNGAGKTTIIRMITAITAPDSGEILLDGNILSENHQQLIGYMPEERGLYKKMKVDEQLRYLLLLKGVHKKQVDEKIDYWLKRLQILGWKSTKLGELSKGMQQKIQFIATVAHEPSLLILDEPFSGLDPINTVLIKDVITELKEKGISIIFSTHRMEQVEEICDRIVLINDGKVLVEDEIMSLKEKHKKGVYALELDKEIIDFQQFSDVEVIESKGRKFVIRLLNGKPGNQFLAEVMGKAEIRRFEMHLPSLNDIFIELIEGTNHE